MKKAVQFILLLVLSFVISACEFDINDFLPSVDNGDDNTTDNNFGGITNPDDVKVPDSLDDIKPEIPDNISNSEITDEKTVLSIIELNDVHGYIMQDEDGREGLSNVSYLINQIREEQDYDNVLLVANGDMFQGTGLVRMSYGRVMIDAMNMMGFDACCLGNHEFDWDLPVILRYFDGDTLNGEANFPLLNANVYQNGQLVTIDGGNIYSSYTYEKAGVKVGMIGYIGNVKSSINGVYADKYMFDTDFSNSVDLIGRNLKDNGCDIIVVSIHDGSADGVFSYEVNNQLAMLKYNDSYLVDAVINGHTHSYQDGLISREGGISMPVIQSSSYRSGSFYSFGRIDLTIDLATKKVEDVSLSHLKASSAGANYDKSVESVIDLYYEMDKDILDEEITYISDYQSRYDEDLRGWVGNVMLADTGADVAICNTGDLRTNLDAGILKFEELYQFLPFDNMIITHTCDASLVKNFLNSDYYFYATKGGTNLKESGTYNVAVIDYVWYSKYYSKLKTSDFNETGLVLRDILLIDSRLHESFDAKTDSSAKIGLMVKKNIICKNYYIRKKMYTYAN